MVKRAFAEPIGAPETIARYIGKLVSQICEQLEEKGLGVRRLDLFCHRVDSGVQVVRAGTAKPVRDPARLTRLLCDRIETIEPGFGIELLVLSASRVEPLDQVQMTSSLIEDTSADLSGLVEIIVNRGHRMYRIAAVESDVPERSFIANLVVWAKTFEKYRPVVLGASMMGVYGKIQREGIVIHLVAHRLTDLSGELASVGERDGAFPLPHGRGDEFHHGSPARIIGGCKGEGYRPDQGAVAEFPLNVASPTSVSITVAGETGLMES